MDTSKCKAADQNNIPFVVDRKARQRRGIFNFITLALLKCLVALVIVPFTILGQQNSSYRRLNIGDTVSDIKLERVINYHKERAKLSDFSGKYVILDFWNKHCGGCLATMPKMQQFQNRFSDSLQIIYVLNPRDTESDFNKLYARSTNLRNLRVPIIIGDSVLYKKFFPHLGDPYQVWLDKNRIVRAMGFDITSTENIQKFIAGDDLDNIPQDISLVYGENGLSRVEGKSLLIANNGAFLKYLLYYNRNPRNDIMNIEIGGSLIGFLPVDTSLPLPDYTMFMRNPTQYIGHAGSGLYFVEDITTKKYVGVRYTKTICEFFLEAYSPPAAKVVLDAPNAYAFFKPNESSHSNVYKNWVRKASLTYEQVIKQRNGELDKMLLRNDLYRLTGLKGVIEERPVECLVLFRIAKEHTVDLDTSQYTAEMTPDGWRFQNSPAEFIIPRIIGAHCNPNDSNGLVFIDEADMKTMKLNMVVKSNFTDITELNYQLKQNGLGLKTEVRKQKVLVLHSN